MMEPIRLTEHEKQILTETYGDAGRLDEGVLYEYQELALAQLRTATRYLDRKYPGHSLHINSFDPANKLNGKATMILMDDTGKDFTLTVSVSEDGTHSCADDYYSVNLQEKYDAFLQDIFSATGYDTLCHTDFPELVGTRTNGTETMEEIIALNPPIMSITHVFLFGADDHGKAAEAAEKACREAKMYGSYTLFFVSRHAGRDIRVLEKNKREYERLSFNCFNIFQE